jgi:hypothetical protein
MEHSSPILGHTDLEGKDHWMHYFEMLITSGATRCIETRSNTASPDTGVNTQVVAHSSKDQQAVSRASKARYVLGAVCCAAGRWFSQVVKLAQVGRSSSMDYGSMDDRAQLV